MHAYGSRVAYFCFLSQAVKALRASSYAPRIAVIGSREHLCGHSVVKRLRGTAQNKACRALCAARGCSLRNELDKQLKARKGEDFGDVALDIEELVDDGKRRGTCAYFGARANLKDADLVFARAAQESEIPNFKGSYLGHFPLVSADFWTSDHLSERSRSVDAFSGTRARGTLTLKRR